MSMWRSGRGPAGFSTVVRESSCVTSTTVVTLCTTEKAFSRISDAAVHPVPSTKTNNPCASVFRMTDSVGRIAFIQATWHRNIVDQAKAGFTDEIVSLGPKTIVSGTLATCVIGAIVGVLI